MINFDANNNVPGNTKAGLPTYHKQTPIATKKVVLKDVQNNNKSLVSNQLESSPLLEAVIADTFKACGTKKSTPDLSPTSSCYQSIISNGANTRIIHEERKVDSVLGKRTMQHTSDKNVDSIQLKQCFYKQLETPHWKIQTQDHNVSCIPASASLPMPSSISFSTSRQSVPFSIGSPTNGLPVTESNHQRLTSKVPQLIESEGSDDQQIKAQLLHQQMFLKQFDESDQTDYIHRLRYLSPAELSRYAFELEKRSIQLSVEEGKEIQRMKVLNILQKPTLPNNNLPTSQLILSDKDQSRTQGTKPI